MRAVVAALVFAAAIPSVARADHKRASVVVVTNLEDHTGRFGEQQLDSWRNHLAARITTSRRFRAAASGNVRTLLAELKSASFRDSFDENLRAGVGRELPAKKLLDVQLYDASGACAVVAAFYDLERAVADKAFSDTTECSDERLRRSFDAIAETITGVEAPKAEEVSAEPWNARVELGSLSLGFASTFGGASGPVVAAELFTVHYGPFYVALLDCGTTMFASKGELFDTLDHTMFYAGSTAGLGFSFGRAKEHQLRAGGGVALYHASAAADFFTGLKINADETDGLVPAAIADARYSLELAPEGPMTLALGGGLRAIVPFGRPFTGDPRLAMVHLFLSLGTN